MNITTEKDSKQHRCFSYFPEIEIEMSVGKVFQDIHRPPYIMVCRYLHIIIIFSIIYSLFVKFWFWLTRLEYIPIVQDNKY